MNELGAQPEKRAESGRQVARLRRQLTQVVGIDFFGANGRQAAEAALTGLEARLVQPEIDGRPEETAMDKEGLRGLHGRTWVTREGVHVDRIASAWLICRFIDPEASFKFVPSKGYQPQPGELRFDMFEAEFTHEGDRCTFEVLCERAGLEDPAVRILGDLARTWRVSYLTAARPGQTLKLTATVPGFGSGSTQTTLPGSTPPPPGDGLAGLLPEQLFTSGVAALLLSLAVGTAILLGVAMVMATPASTRLRRRLSPHVGGPRRRAKKASVRERFEGASGLLKATEQAFERFSFWGKLRSMLERADMPLRTSEFFYCMIGPAFLFGLFAAVMAFSPLIILPPCSIGGLLPLGFLSFKAKRRVNAIDEQLPDLLITMAASLKAGHSFRQAMQAVVDEGQPPISDEFKRVLTEAQLGRPIDDALAEMADRVQSKNLSFVMTAVTVQRSVGGSLAGIFDMVADAVRQRQAFARKIKGLTAMGRASAYTLVGMPFALAGIITAINADYMSPLYYTSTGHKMIIVGLVSMAIGAYMLRKIASFRG